MSDRLLVLVRHGQSDWNLKNLFTGWKDPGLTELGVAEAKAAGRKLKEQGLSITRDKAAVMRAVSGQFRRDQMGQVYATIARLER